MGDRLCGGGEVVVNQLTNQPRISEDDKLLCGVIECEPTQHLLP
jgi:hypothetical protein